MMRRISTLAAAAAFVAAFGLAGVAKSNPPAECIALGLGAHPNPCHANLAALLSDDLDVTKTLLSGPRFASDAATDAADEVFPATDPNPNDDGVIGVTLDHSQHYVVEIEITNVGDDNDSDGIVLADTFGADIDLDPTAEEDWDTGGFPLDGVCADACDGAGFDGVDVDGDCSVITSQPPNPSGK